MFPVTKVDLEKDIVPKDWQPISETDKKVMNYCKSSPWIRYLEEIAHNLLDGKPENHENSLVGLVVIGRRLEEEKVTVMLSVIKDSLAMQS